MRPSTTEATIESFKPSVLQSFRCAIQSGSRHSCADGGNGFHPGGESWVFLAAHVLKAGP
ncbi:hypothetical protein ACVWY0_001939 [Arthrobacter sp. UYNi723]